MALLQEKKFQLRFIFALIYAGLSIGLIYAGETSFLIYIGLVALLSIHEFCSILSQPRSLQIPSYILSIVLILLGFSDSLLPSSFSLKSKEILYALLVFIPCIGFINALFFEKRNPIVKLGHFLLISVYINLPVYLLIKTAYHTGVYTFEIPLGILILVWMNDTFAYLGGRLFGKKKLFPRISPGKTVEGALCGFLFTLAMGYILSNFWTLFSVTSWVLISTLVSIFGVLGDLIQSMFKRSLNIKDSGKMIPGHGGILDRLDSLFFVSPVLYGYLNHLS